tara:strand:- start:32 stop:202 length:171 start_codon:yes stop_codon:yes gene_type:complete
MKKIRSISISSEIDELLEQDSKKRGLTISANLSRILYEHLSSNKKMVGEKLSIIQK